MPRRLPRARIQAEWETCWEALLCLPIDDLPTQTLHRRAATLVSACRQKTGGIGAEWLEDETRDARCFVAEQLSDSPDGHWNRLMVMLDGALSVLRTQPRERAA